jgi:hypothetical protein
MEWTDGTQGLQTAPRRNGVTAVVAALLIAVLAWVYRFNTLGDALGGFHNDEFLVVSRAAQMLLGDLPVRDFFDPGAPLTYAASAGALKLLGYSLIAEAVLTVSALALGAALIVWLVMHATGSVTAALGSALLAVLTGPRYYNYPKITLYAVALVLMWRYIDVPSRGRVIPLAILTAVAFLFRHDHGAYIGVLTVVTMAAAAAPDWRSARTPALTYALGLVVLLAPYFLFLQVNGGIVSYFRAAISWAQRDAARTQLRPPMFAIDWSAPLFEVEPPEPEPLANIRVRWQPSVGAAQRAGLERRYRLEPLTRSEGSYQLLDASSANLRAIVAEPAIADTAGIDRSRFVLTEPPTLSVWRQLRREVAPLRTRPLPGVFRRENGLPFLYHLAVWVPVLAGLTLVLARRRVAFAIVSWPNAHRKLVVLISLGALFSYVFLRGSLESRIADVSVPVAVLGAWLTVVHASPSLGGLLIRVPLVVLVVILTTLSIDAEARVVTELRRTGFLVSPEAIVGRTALVWQRLSASPPLPDASPEGEPIFPLARYVKRCTADTDRVLAVMFMPELYFYAQRGFAGGLVTVQPGFVATSGEQQLAIARIERQSVPLVITEGEAGYAVYKREFPSLTAFIDEHYQEAGTISMRTGDVRVLTRRDRGASVTDSASGLPCFRS